MAKSHRKAPSIELRKIVSEVLKEYGDEVEREVAEVVPDVADRVVQELYETSPVGTDTPNRGRYAKGWTYSYVTSVYGTVTVKVHNKTDWQLTHLLEWGHAIKRGGRTVGFAQAYPHIKQRNEFAKELLIKKVEERIK